MIPPRNDWRKLLNRSSHLIMKSASAKVRPDEFILAALSPEERLDAALRVAREAFKKTELTVADVESAVRRVRRKRHGASASRR